MAVQVGHSGRALLGFFNLLECGDITCIVSVILKKVSVTKSHALQHQTFTHADLQGSNGGEQTDTSQLYRLFFVFLLLVRSLGPGLGEAVQNKH